MTVSGERDVKFVASKQAMADFRLIWNATHGEYINVALSRRFFRQQLPQLEAFVAYCPPFGWPLLADFLADDSWGHYHVRSGRGRKRSQLA